MTDLVVITDIPTPYRQPVFAALAEQLDLLVVYVAERSSRPWHWWEHLDGHDSRFLARALPSSPLSWVQPTRRLRALLERTKPTAVIAGGWNHPTTWTALASRDAGGVGVWVESTAHDTRRLAMATAPLKRSVATRATGVIVPGARSREYAEGLGAAHTFLAPNAVDNRLFARSHESPPPRQGQVLYVGRLAPEKGIDLLAPAMGALGPGVTLQVVGDGPLRARLEQDFARRGLGLSVTGMLSSPHEVAPFLHEASALVLPSRSEPWGLVVNEAVAAGTPAVVSDRVGCAVDLVEPGVTGEVFTSGDSHDLGAKLGAVLARGVDDAVRERCRLLAERHSPEACARGLRTFHDAVVAGAI